MIPDSNILNNKRVNSSFSVQILSIFTLFQTTKSLFFTLSHCFWDVKITFSLNVILVGWQGLSNVVEKVVCIQPFCGFALVVVSEITIFDNCIYALAWVPLQGAWSSGRKELNRYVEVDIDSLTWEFLWWGIEVLYLYCYEECLWTRIPVGNTGR